MIHFNITSQDFLPVETNMKSEAQYRWPPVSMRSHRVAERFGTGPILGQLGRSNMCGSDQLKCQCGVDLPGLNQVQKYGISEMKFNIISLANLRNQVQYVRHLWDTAV